MNYQIKETQGEDEGGKFVELEAFVGDQRIATKTYNLDGRSIELARRSIEATVLSIPHPGFEVFCDEAYFMAIALRPVGVRDFDLSLRFDDRASAVRASHIIAKWMEAGQ